MTRGIVVLFFAASLLSAAAQAATSIQPATPVEEPWWCLKGDGTPCSQAELRQSQRYKQVLVLPTGFVRSEYELFRREFDQIVSDASSLSATFYTTEYSDRILYIGAWLPGGAMESDESNFSAKVFNHPTRGRALTLDQEAVIDWVEFFKAEWVPEISPWGVLVLFNTLELNVTPNASTPTFLGKSYGIAKITRTDLATPYTMVHELAHAALNFLDEYTEDGLQDMSIRTLDYLTPFTLLGSSWGGWVKAIGNFFGVYTYKISEILAANGAENVDVTHYPSRVVTSGYSPDPYEYEGGMFFGKGTFHDSGANVMNNDSYTDAPDDGFDYNHSESQERVIEQVFDHPDRAPRPNDRIRNAGPATNWPSQWGSTARLMLFDADKNHHQHPSRLYDVQVGWYERDWKVCWKWGAIPYPCYDEIWKTAQKAVAPARRTINIKTTGLYGLASIFQRVACGLGLETINSGGSSFKLCEQSLSQITDAFVPTLEFPLPYQDVAMPTSQWLTKYFWRFRTHNGTYVSGWTGWSSFHRIL